MNFILIMNFIFIVVNVKCKLLVDVDDVKLMLLMKSEYSVGENVIYKCNGGFEKEFRQCLFDGMWFGGGFVCGCK